jgi:Ala-tRNA(Pro) deacylase
MYREKLLKRQSQIQAVLKHLKQDPVELCDELHFDGFNEDVAGRTLHDRLREGYKQEIDRIEVALGKIRTGGYGICRTCQQPIEKGRLDAFPETDSCYRCKGLGRRDRNLSRFGKEALMPVMRKLREALDGAKVSYEVYNHPLAYTAQEIAAAQHIRGREMAKVVILKIDGSMAMAVLPAGAMIDFGRVRTGLGADRVSLATEDEFVALFPECEIGAMPPFGNLFGLPVYVDPALEKDETIFFNAGNHHQTVRLKYRDFKQLVKPRVFPLTEERKKAA